jgi:hypothetical protein
MRNAFTPYLLPQDNILFVLHVYQQPHMDFNVMQIS